MCTYLRTRQRMFVKDARPVSSYLGFRHVLPPREVVAERYVCQQIVGISLQYTQGGGATFHWE